MNGHKYILIIDSFNCFLYLNLSKRYPEDCQGLWDLCYEERLLKVLYKIKIINLIGG